MPSFRKAFPSKYFKTDDLDPTTPAVFTIKRCGFELIGTGGKADDKLVVYFVESNSKPLILNLVNSESIAEIAGTEDYERWSGTRLQLVVARTEFQGRRVPCIRIQAPAARGASKPPKASRPDPDDPMPTAMDASDDISF